MFISTSALLCLHGIFNITAGVQYLLARYSCMDKQVSKDIYLTYRSPYIIVIKFLVT